MPSKEQKLLDDLEDAEDALRRHRKLVGALVAILVVVVALFISGIVVGQWGALHHTDTGRFATDLIIPSVIAAIGAVVRLVTHYDSLDEPPHVTLREAQRAHRDYLMEQAQL